MMISHVSCRQLLRGVVSWLAASLVLTVSVASAQGPQASSHSPFNVAIPVDRQLASLFSNLYGPNGLIVNSLAVLPSGDTHSAHFHDEMIPFTLPPSGRRRSWTLTIDTSEGHTRRRRIRSGHAYDLQGRSLVVLLSPRDVSAGGG